MLQEEFPNTTEPTPIDERVDEVYTTGNLTLHVITTQHSEGNIQDLPGIIRAVNKSPVLIPEYFPPRFDEEHATGLPVEGTMVDAYKDRNHLFDVLVPAYPVGATIFCVDPAYNAAMAVHEFVLASAQYSPYYSIPPLLGAVTIAYLESKKEMSRRRFLHVSEMVAASIVLQTPIVAFLRAFLTDDPNNFNVPWDYRKVKEVEDDLRHTAIAMQLYSLGRDKEEMAATLIYPPGHWEKIKHYLDDEEELSQAWQRWSWAYALSPDLVTGKAYVKQEDGSWKGVEKWKLVD